MSSSDWQHLSNHNIYWKVIFFSLLLSFPLSLPLFLFTLKTQFKLIDEKVFLFSGHVNIHQFEGDLIELSSKGSPPPPSLIALSRPTRISSNLSILIPPLHSIISRSWRQKGFWNFIPLFIHSTVTRRRRDSRIKDLLFDLFLINDEASRRMLRTRHFWRTGMECCQLKNSVLDVGLLGTPLVIVLRSCEGREVKI